MAKAPTARRSTRPAQAPPIPAGTKRLAELMTEYRALGAEKRKAELAQEKLKSSMIPLLSNFEGRQYANPEIGLKATVSARFRESIDKNKLLELNVSPTIIRKATVRTDYDQLDVRVLKAGTDEGDGGDE